MNAHTLTPVNSVNSVNPFNPFNPVNPFKRLSRLARVLPALFDLVRVARLLRPSRPSWFVSSVPAHIIPLRSFNPFYPVNPFKRLSRLVCAHLVLPALFDLVRIVRLVCIHLVSSAYVSSCPRCSIWCVCLVCLVSFALFDLVRVARLLHCSTQCVCVARLLRPSRLCYVVRPSWFVSSVSAHIIPLRSFKHVKPVNSFKRLSCSFDPFQIFRAFDSYNYPDNSGVSICLPPRALRRVKINFFKARRYSKCLT